MLLIKPVYLCSHVNVAALKRSVTIRYEGFPKVTKRYIQIGFASIGQMKRKCDSDECQSSSVSGAHILAAGALNQQILVNYGPL